MKLPKIREALEAVKALILGPYTSRFPQKPHVPHRNFRGQPRFNREKCMGCLACEQVCPTGAIGHEDKTEGPVAIRTIFHYTDTCIFCGECEAACPADHEGIKLSGEWDLAFFDRRQAFESIEKELQVCEICGRPVACRAHLNWIAGKLGELAYSSPALYLSRLRELNVADENLLAVYKEGGRSDRMKILCSRCRRDTTL